MSCFSKLQRNSNESWHILFEHLSFVSRQYVQELLCLVVFIAAIATTSALQVCETSNFGATHVHLDVVLFKYCDLSAVKKDGYKKSSSTLNELLVYYGGIFRETFGWDVKVTARLGTNCASSPIQSPVAVDYLSRPGTGSRTVALQINIVYKPKFKSTIDYMFWASSTKEQIHSAVSKYKSKSMVTFVLHGELHQHDISTKHLSDLIILPNSHYHLEQIQDLRFNYGRMTEKKIRHVLISSFACTPRYIGAKPYIFMDLRLNTRCDCRCPIGFAFKQVGPIKKCVEREDSVTNKCGRLAKCYSFEASVLQGESKNKCLLKAFDKAKIPCPWDNYVAWNANPALSHKSPRVTGRLTAGNSEQTANFRWEELRDPKVSFTTLLDQKFTFTFAGIYFFELYARDFDGLEKCTTEIRISDNVVPSSTSTCPEGTSKPGRYHTPVQVKEIEQFVKAFSSFVDNGVYGPCEKGIIQTKRSFQTKCLDGSTCHVVTVGNAVNLKRRKADSKYLTEIRSTILSEPPGQKREKCISVRAELLEKTTRYTCYGSSEALLSGDKCASKRCYFLHGKDLYKSHVVINTATQSATFNLMTTLVAGFNAQATEIHERIADPVVKSVTRDLGKLIDINLSRTGFGAASFDDTGSVPHLQSTIQCRYQVPEASIGENWQVWHWDKPNAVELTQESNSVKIECWTRLGKLSSTQFKLIIHPTASLDICEDFVEQSFYQSLTAAAPDDAPSEYCNVPQSDFAELTVHFSSWVGRDRGSHQERQYYFWNMMCVALYDHGEEPVEDFSGRPAVAIPAQGPQKELVNAAPEPDYRLIERFGVNLRNSLVTFKKTRVEFQCVINYRDRTVRNSKDPKAFVKVTCPHTLTFHDCDEPEFPLNEKLNPNDPNSPIKDCKDLENCYASCGDKIKPYQYCGPKQLTFKQAQTLDDLDQTFLLDRSKDQCCSTPLCSRYYGTSFTCNALGADVAIKRCEPRSKPIFLIYDVAQQQPMIVFGVVLSTLLVVAFTIRGARNQIETLPFEGHYSPLL